MQLSIIMWEKVSEYYRNTVLYRIFLEPMEDGFEEIFLMIISNIKVAGLIMQLLFVARYKFSLF